MCHSASKRCIINKCQGANNQLWINKPEEPAPPFTSLLRLYFQPLITWCIEWLQCQCHFNTVGDPHQQEANKLPICEWKCVSVRPQMGCEVAVSCRGKDLCPLSVILPSDRAVRRLRMRLLRGRPMPSATQHPLSPAGWLRSRGQPGHSTRRQTFDSDLVCVDWESMPEGVHCSRAALPSCDLRAGFDKVATCAVRLFLTGEETPWKLTSWSCYRPNPKITLLEGVRNHLCAHYFMFAVSVLMPTWLLKMTSNHFKRGESKHGEIR